MDENIIEYNILIVGDMLVGKTGLFMKYITGSFPNNYLATLGFDSKLKTIQIKGGKTIQVKITDTSGGERFRNIIKKYYKKSHGIILVYDITNKNSFESIKNWIISILNEVNTNISIFLVGNKSDCEEKREITKEQGKNLAKIHGFLFSECSAKYGVNVDFLFDELIKKMHGKFEKGEHIESNNFYILKKYLSF